MIEVSRSLGYQSSLNQFSPEPEHLLSIACGCLQPHVVDRLIPQIMRRFTLAPRVQPKMEFNNSNNNSTIYYYIHIYTECYIASTVVLQDIYQKNNRRVTPNPGLCSRFPYQAFSVEFWSPWTSI